MAATVQYVPKEKIYPYLGYAWPSIGVAFVREDLPGMVKEFVEAHERRHLIQRRDRHWIWLELDATIFLDWKLLPGFMAAFCMSMTPARLRLLWRRLRGEK